MRTVWKFAVAVDDRASKVAMPSDAEVIYVEKDVHLGQTIGVMWAIVETENPIVTREFCIHGTGHPILFDEHYIGTFHSGSYVWHIFEIRT